MNNTSSLIRLTFGADGVQSPLTSYFNQRSLGEVDPLTSDTEALAKVAFKTTN